VKSQRCRSRKATRRSCGISPQVAVKNRNPCSIAGFLLKIKCEIGDGKSIDNNTIVLKTIHAFPIPHFMLCKYIAERTGFGRYLPVNEADMVPLAFPYGENWRKIDSNSIFTNQLFHNPFRQFYHGFGPGLSAAQPWVGIRKKLCPEGALQHRPLN